MDDMELAELDLAVARATGRDVIKGFGVPGEEEWLILNEQGIYDWIGNYQPTRNWSDCGPLVEWMRNRGAEVLLMSDGLKGRGWEFQWTEYAADTVRGPTPLIAICRAVVAMEEE